MNTTQELEHCIRNLHRQIMPEIPLPESTEAKQTSTGNWFGMKVRSIGSLRIKLVEFLREKGFLSSKPIQERSIKINRFYRCIAAAGMLAKNLNSQELESKTNKVLELWQLEPLEFAHWCLENNQPISETFVIAELLPWLMESFSDRGMRRNNAADLALELIQLINLYEVPTVHSREHALGLLDNWKSDDEGDVALAHFLHNDLQNDPDLTLDDIQGKVKQLTATSEDYLRSHIGQFSTQEKLQLLRECLSAASQHSAPRKKVRAVDLLAIAARKMDLNRQRAINSGNEPWLINFDNDDHDNPSSFNTAG